MGSITGSPALLLLVGRRCQDTLRHSEMNDRPGQPWVPRALNRLLLSHAPRGQHHHPLDRCPSQKPRLPLRLLLCPGVTAAHPSYWIPVAFFSASNTLLNCVSLLLGSPASRPASAAHRLPPELPSQSPCSPAYFLRGSQLPSG